MPFLDRAELLLGSQALSLLRSRRVIIFGVGGVGSWCAEALVRTGVGQLTIVDADIVSDSNINRQLMATHSTIGRPKVEVLRERLLDINPGAQITAIHDVFCEENAASYELGSYDYVMDCIDSLKDKVALLLAATASGARVFSSMGAALKLDPTQIRVAEFWKVRGCPLGAALRKRMRRAGVKPSQPVTCVYSEELLSNKRQSPTEEGKSPNGSVVHITGIFGFTLASLVVNDVARQAAMASPQ